MLTLANSPAAIAFTRNPVNFRLQATDADGDPYGAKAAYASVTMNNNGLQANNTIVVSWEEPDGSTGEVTFTAKASPASDSEVQAQPSGLGDLEYFQAVAAKMAIHPVLSAFFTLAVSSPSSGLYRITFTSLDTSSDFTVTLDITAIAAGAGATKVEAAAVADNTPDEYKVFLDVFFEDSYESGVFSEVASLEAKPDAAGYVIFNIQSILHAEAKRSFSAASFPNLTIDPAVISGDNLRRYYVRYRENYIGVYDDPLNTDGDWVTTTASVAMIGGLSQRKFAEVNFFGDMTAENSLLTWYPDRKTVSPAQPEYLPWFNYTGSEMDVCIELKLYSATALLVTAYVYASSPYAAPAATTALIPVGLDQLRTQLGSTYNNVVKYTVQVTDDDYSFVGAVPVYFSPVRTYYVDESRYEELHYIFYLNSFSCPLTLRCTGNLTKRLSVEAQDSQRILPYNYAADFAENFTHDSDWENTYTYRSGYLPKLEVDALQELLAYRQAWEIESQGYTPLYIQGKNFNITETFQYLHAIEFLALRALASISYSGIEGGVSAGTGNFWALENTDLWELETSTDLWELENT